MNFLKLLPSTTIDKALVVFVWVLLTTSSVRAEQQAFQIQYEAANDYVSAGTANWSMVEGDSGWVMQLSTSPSRLVKLAGVGKIVETTVLSAPEPPFQAISYSYTDSKRKRKNFHASRSETSEEITIVRPDKTISVPVDGNIIIDRLSATLAVATELATNPNFQHLQFKVLDRNGVRDMEFNNLGREQIKLEKLTFDAFVVESGRPGGKRKTRTWFAVIGDSKKSQRPLPVKIEQYKNNELVLRLSLTKYTLN